MLSQNDRCSSVGDLTFILSVFYWYDGFLGQETADKSNVKRDVGGLGRQGQCDRSSSCMGQRGSGSHNGVVRSLLPQEWRSALFPAFSPQRLEIEVYSKQHGIFDPFTYIISARHP